MDYIKENIAEFEVMNLPIWHKAGYTGKGVTICVLDTELGTDKMNHADKVILRQIAPDANIEHFHFINASRSKKKAVIDWIKENNPDIVNCSFVSKTGYIPYFEQLQHLDIPVICATGNDANEDYIPYPANSNWTIAIGAYEELDKEVEKYSNKGLEIDAVAFTDIAMKNFNNNIITVGGTSISTPVTSEMLALYVQLLKEYGLRLGREEARKFIHNNCYNIGVKGRDNESGFGLFILPKTIPREELELVKRISSLDALHPYVRQLLQQHISQAAAEGIKVFVVETERSSERQAYLYAKGRTEPGGIVTYAKPGQSIHEYKCAYDICPMVDGKLAWDRHDLFDRLGEIGKSLGLTWGGEFNKIVDKPHFQWTNGLTLKELQAGKCPPRHPELSNWSTKAHEWIMDNDISDGTRPKDNVTREEEWTMMHRHDQYIDNKLEQFYKKIENEFVKK